MATPISASFGPDAVSEVIALTGGDPQRMAQLGGSRPEFKPALAVLHLIKQAGAPPMPTQSIAQQAMNPPPPQNPGATGLGAVNVPKGPPMGQMPGRPLMQMAAVGPSGNQTTPPPQPMPQMAGGGLLALDNSAFDEQSFSGGGIVAFAGGGDSKAERRRALMNEVRKGGVGALVAQQKIRDLEREGAGIVSGLSSSSPQRLADLGVSGDVKVDNSAGLAARAGELRDYPQFNEYGETPKISDAYKLPTPEEKAQALGVYNTNATSMFGGGMGGASPGMQFKALSGEQGNAGINALENARVAPPPPGARTAPPPPARGGSGGTRTGGGPTRNNPLQQNNAAAVPEQSIDQLFADNQRRMGPDLVPPGTSAEDRDARRQEDLWSMLAQIGFNTMAGTSQFGLENLGKGTAAAMPAMQEAIKSRRADDREERKETFAAQLAARGVKGQMLTSAITQFTTAGKEKQDLMIAQATDATNRAQIEASERNALLMANKQTDQGDIAAGLASKDPAVRAIWKQILDSKKYYDPNRDERSDEALIGQKRDRIKDEIKIIGADRSIPIAEKNKRVAVKQAELLALSKPGGASGAVLAASYFAKPR